MGIPSIFVMLLLLVVVQDIRFIFLLLLLIVSCSDVFRTAESDRLDQSGSPVASIRSPTAAVCRVAAGQSRFPGENGDDVCVHFAGVGRRIARRMSNSRRFLHSQTDLYGPVQQRGGQCQWQPRSRCVHAGRFHRFVSIATQVSRFIY